MGNCLVTKLKEGINNPSLSPLGCIRIPVSIVSATSNSLLDIIYTTAANAKSVKVYDANGNYLSEIQPNQASVSVSRSLLPNACAFIDVEKYELKSFILYSRPTIALLYFKGDELKYCSHLQTINISSNLEAQDSLSDICYNKASLATLSITSCKCTGKCSDLAACPSLTTVNTRYSKNITGTLESLAKALLPTWVSNRTITLNSDTFTLKGVKVEATDTTIAVTQANVVVTTVINGTTRTYTWDGTTGTYTGFQS